MKVCLVCLVYLDNAICFVHFVDFVCFVGEEVVGLLRDALDDGALRGGHNDGDNREARADRALLAAGIMPGDPRLHLPAGTSAPADRNRQE